MATQSSPDHPCFESDRGAVASEYALLAGLIAVVIAGAVGVFGLQVLDLFQVAVDRWP
ncbi:Flp family type IVb pilin [Ornithinimicrobium cavernae]|uniref:Flp family type IVb pilin n=1 Tax=Ornithinimicrobium cavernae TaxID=2666047 RepID=UPI000D69C3D1|nr:Flp family type IVb pilin [Ornithinimicrobium cavernae]